MASGFQGASRLSVHRAFVVHFGAAGHGGRRRFHGRVEHLSSGRTAHFSSLARLLGFVATVLSGFEPTNPSAEASSAKRHLRRTRTVGRSR